MAQTQWQKTHPEHLAQYRKRYNANLKATVFNHYGYKCSCPKCPEVNPKFLTIDHMNNDGAAHRKRKRTRSGLDIYRWLIKNNFPSDYQILCWNCNTGRYYNGGVCPHIFNC